jgi:hypothetical protein
MTKQLSKIALAAVIALVCFGVRAQESSRQAPEKKPNNSDNPLQGLTKVGVIIDSTPLDEIGLSEERLRSEAVSRLRSAGITVVGNKDSDTNGQTPVLKISVFFSLCGPRCYSSVVLFEFKEKVTPNRHPSSNIEATTWLRWSYGNYDDFPTERIPENLMQSLRGGLELFLLDVRSTN